MPLKGGKAGVSTASELTTVFLPVLQEVPQVSAFSAPDYAEGVVDDGDERFSVRRWLGLSLVLSLMFVFPAAAWADPNNAITSEGLKALCIIGLLMLTALVQRFQRSSGAETMSAAALAWWKEKILAVLLACCLSAAALDMFAWREAESLFSASSAARTSWTAVIALSLFGCVVASCCGFVSRRGWKRWLLNAALVTSLTAIFAEIALVMAVREPVLPHSAAIYERFATFYLTAAAAIFTAYRIYLGADEPLEPEAD